MELIFKSLRICLVMKLQGYTAVALWSLWLRLHLMTQDLFLILHMFYFICIRQYSKSSGFCTKQLKVGGVHCTNSYSIPFTAI